MAQADIAGLTAAVSSATSALTSLENHIGAGADDTSATVTAVASLRDTLVAAVAAIPAADLT
jgi:hypothetical protein